jgi:serine/threonine protein phosphatase PrpC
MSGPSIWGLLLWCCYRVYRGGVAHVGDSRAYLLPTKLRKLTKDHSRASEGGCRHPTDVEHHPSSGGLLSCNRRCANVEVDIVNIRVERRELFLALL